MNGKLKRVVQWTMYIFVTIVILLLIVSVIVSILAPTFFPCVDISGFENCINTLGIILSFLSVALGVYSIWQAFENGRQATEMIDSIHDIKQQQATLLVTLKSTPNISGSDDKSRKDWVPDNVTE